MAKLEGGSKDVYEAMQRWHNRSLGHRLYDAFTVAGLRVEAIEPGRLLCSFMVPPRLTSVRSPSHGRAHGSTVCRSVELKIVYTCVCLYVRRNRRAPATVCMEARWRRWWNWWALR